ncbi:hypothetical protein [Halosimplex salinum]|uniref:hypothetical protein n=1 Tax=Halosimplex salinum TaxID=1710538 RepID=UPI002E275720
MTDIGVALFPGVLVILLFQVVLPASMTVGGYRLETLTLPLAGVMILVGAIFVYLTPAYTTSADWVTAMVTFYQRSDELGHEEAKQHTQIERVYPNRGAIERTDGAFLGLVQVAPPTMALATDEEWAQKAEGFQNFLNTSVEFPIQIYSTTRAFPAEEYLARYESRLDDPDVEANPQLEALIENYVEWYERELDERRMTIRDHYVVVPVTPREVQFERESVVQKLAGLPVLGVFIRAYFAPRIEEQRDALFEELDDRLRRIRTGLREIDGCNAHRVDTPAATQVIGEFWAGESQDYGDMEQVLRTRTMVGGVEQ